MSPPVRTIHEPPNRENTIPFTEYLASSPEKFSLEDDKFVLYAGGSNFSIDITTEAFFDDTVNKILNGPISIFVLNVLVIIWSDGSNIGLDIPYQKILVHALNDENNLLLVLHDNEEVHSPQRPSDPEVVEFEITSKSPIRSVLYPVPNTLQAIYHAMAKCSAFHYDEESEALAAQFEYDIDVEIPDRFIGEAKLNNQGNADDLDDGIEVQVQEPAGMYVDVGYGPIAGRIRKREHEDDDPKKFRRV